METELKVTDLYFWLMKQDKGVTNKQVNIEFGNNYKIAWERLKRNKNTFHEDGKWYSWDNAK